MLLDCDPKALRDLTGLAQGTILEEDAELVSPQASQRIALPQVPAEERAEAPEQLVPGLVAAGIVDQFEAIEVQTQERVLRGRAGEVGYHPHQPAFELPTLHPALTGRTSPLIIGFIVVSTAVFLVVGQPVAILLAVGALNALVLPVGLSAMLVAARRAGLMNGYRHPGALTLAGAAAALAMAVLGAQTVGVMVGGWLR